MAHRLRFGAGERGRVARGAVTRLPTVNGLLDAVGFRDHVTWANHVAVLGRRTAHPYVAVHRECLRGDVFASTACDCARRPTDDAITIAREGGVLSYLRSTGARRFGHVRGQDDRLAADDDGAVGAMLVELGHDAVRLLPGATSGVQLARPDLAVVDIGSVSVRPSHTAPVS